MKAPVASPMPGHLPRYLLHCSHLAEQPAGHVALYTPYYRLTEVSVRAASDFPGSYLLLQIAVKREGSVIGTAQAQ